MQSHDTLRKVVFAVTGLTGACLTMVLALAALWPTINHVEAGKSSEYPNITPKTYQLGYDRVLDEASGAINDQSWDDVLVDRHAGTITASSTMAITGWKHTITVRVARRGEYVSRVYAMSEGDDAAGDLGQNARNLKDYYSALDARLGAANVSENK